jgi:hypothetical protein
MAAKIALVLLSVVACTLAEPGRGWGWGWGHAAPVWRSAPWGWGGWRADGAPGIHPGGGISSVSRSTQGIGKRSADAEPGWGHAPAWRSAWRSAAPWARGWRADGALGVHPHGAVSSVSRSTQGIGKRSADAEPEAEAGHGWARSGWNAAPWGAAPWNAAAWNAAPWGWGQARRSWAWPSATSSEYRSPQGLRGKRSAEPWSSQHVSRALPWGGISTYAVNDNVWSASVHDHRRTPLASWGYGWAH